MQDLDQTQTETISGGVAKRPPLTTLAIGEEGGGISKPFGEDLTTLAFGEEGCIPKLPITAAGALGSF